MKRHTDSSCAASRGSTSSAVVHAHAVQRLASASESAAAVEDVEEILDLPDARLALAVVDLLRRLIRRLAALQRGERRPERVAVAPLLAAEPDERRLHLEGLLREVARRVHVVSVCAE